MVTGMGRWTAAMAATLLIGIGLGCSSGGTNTGTVAAAVVPAPAPIAVQPPAPEPSQAGDAIVTSGPVVVEQQLDVVALRAGVIASMDADVGSGVQKGQMLARLDDRQVAADRSAAEYKAESLESDLKNWQSAVDVKKSDLQRAEAMRQAGINTQEALDHAKADLTATQYEVERQRREMQSAQATLQSLDLELEKTRIAAPFGGVVSQRYVRLGQYVVTGDKLFQVTGNSPLEIRFTLPEKDVTALRRGDLVTVAPTPEFRVTSTAAVTHLSPVVDPGSGTIEVTAVLTRKVPGLLPGMVASVRVARRP
jgi:RND family efflux transporter MFP subunit